MSFAKFIPLPLALVLAGCAHKAPETPEKPLQAVKVSTAVAQASRLPGERIIAGSVTARTSMAVSARLPGHIRELRVREGDTVQPGQTIAVIDSRETETAIRQAEAARNEARAGLPEVEAAIAAAGSQAELARTTFRRMQELHNNKSITGQEFDEAQARLRLAESQVKMAEARRMQARERIQQAEEGLRRAMLQQTYATVTALFAGLVIERRAEPGTFAGPGTPIVMLEKSGDYRLEVPVEESLLKGLRTGHRVTVELDAPAELVISEILPSLNAQSRTATVRINLPYKPGLRSGMSGRIRLPGEERDAVTIPVAAVRANGQLQTVFTVQNNRARAALVTLGDTRDGRVEVLTGIAANDRVIVSPPAALVDGAPVEVAQ